MILAIEQQIINIAKRSNIVNSDSVDPVYLASLDASLFEVIVRYIASPVIILIIFLFLSTLVIFIRMIRKKVFWESKEFGFIFTAWIAFLAPISWHVLASGHSYIHTHINFVLWNIPFTFFSIPAFLVIFDYLNSKNHKIIYCLKYISFIGGLSITFLFNYVIYSNNENFSWKYWICWIKFIIKFFI
jgi:hypothetical protein